jgi:hypothetical protein
MVRDQLTRWRKAIETLDLVAEGSRRQLNQLYTEIVTQLRQEFQTATFSAAAPSLDLKRAVEASDPDTKTKRLWELTTHHPCEVANNPIWTLLLLGGKSLIGKSEHIDEGHLFPFAQVEGFWQEVHQRHGEDYYSKLLLSYTALLPIEKHPFRTHSLIRALYEAGDVISVSDLKSLQWQTNDLDELQPIQESLNSLQDHELLLPEALKTPLIDDLLLALAPIFSEGEELISLAFNGCWLRGGLFFDASPLADQLLSLSKTRLVERGIRINHDTLMPAEVYKRLARHRNSGPQAEVASCIHTPAEVLEELSHLTSKEIIYPLASNPMTPLPVLRQLMHWSGWGAKTVERYVQNNPAYVGGEVWQLMEMGRLQLQTDQRKKDVLLACLDLLAIEPDPLDSLRILLNAALWASWRLEPSTLRLRMIQKGWASDELMQAAAWSWHWQERLAVASSPLAPAAALAKLQGDGLPFIRHAALQPRRSAEVAAEAASPSGWMGQLAALAAADPVACVRHPRFAEWLDQQPERVDTLLCKQHRTIQAAGDLPGEYFCWCLSQLSEREQLRLLMHRQVPKQALDQLVRHDAEHDKLISRLPERKQGELADLVATSAASHLQQSNPALLRCSLAVLEKADREELMPHEIAFFVMGFYNPADVSMLHTIDLLKLLLHPGASQDLRRNLGQELDNRKDEWHKVVDWHAPAYALDKAIHIYNFFIGGQDHALNRLKITGHFLGLEDISEALRAWLITQIADLATQVLIDGGRHEWLKTLVDFWPAVLSPKETKKLIASRNASKRLLAACFGDLNESQMEALASDPREEIRFALALLRPCQASVLEKLSADVNALVSRAALQNRCCPLAKLSSAQGRSPLRNPNLPEEAARNLLKGPAGKQILKHAAEILCWTPSLMQEVIDSMRSDELSSFCLEMEYGLGLAPFGERPYAPELLSWMAQIPADSISNRNAFRQLAAAHPRTPVPVLEGLAKDPNIHVRASVASNPACPTALHRFLREEQISGNTLAVVASPNYPVDWLADHASDPDPDLRAMVSRHPHCPLPLLIQLLADTAKTSNYGLFNNRTVAEVAAASPALSAEIDPNSYETAALTLLRSTKPSSRARRLALRSPYCPLPLLRRCATSLDWRERHAVASHPATPPRQLKVLLQDANQHVVQVAIKRCSETTS